LAERIEISVPDIGDFEDVEVVEILVAKGDEVEFDDPLVSVESDKATMEIPSTAAGVVAEIRVAEGDRVSEGSVLVVLEGAAETGAGAAEEDAPADDPAEKTSAVESPEPPPTPVATEAPVDPEIEDAAPSPTSAPLAEDVTSSEPGRREMSPAASRPVPDRAGVPHASPLVRRYARELGVPIETTSGSGPAGRVLVDDLKAQVRERFAGGTESAGARGEAGIPPVPSVDFARFGPVQETPLTRVQKVAGPGLHRSWLNVPHVTQNDEADITELERFRRDRKEAAAERGIRLSPLVLVMKAVVVVLREFPKFRSSLAPEGDRLIVKDYFHLGVAVDTDQGLVVPVIRDVDRKGVFALAEEIADTAERARARKLGPDDLAGACFTISSLGGIGGGHFSPIVNAPEVAILGLSKTRVAPVWQGPSPLDPAEDGESPLAEGPGAFVPRITLPFSLSYDHRVIDGADAVRFTSRLARVLADPSFLLL
jgi:pyruvate dehydrogenase E2 component (dihydrolipoamide acetyltransferase)